jgi:hypothetical protein
MEDWAHSEDHYLKTITWRYLASTKRVRLTEKGAAYDLEITADTDGCVPSSYGYYIHERTKR